MNGKGKVWKYVGKRGMNQRMGNEIGVKCNSKINNKMGWKRKNLTELNKKKGWKENSESECINIER